MRLGRLVVVVLVVVPLTLWACAAVWFDGPLSRPLAGGMATLLGVSVIGVVGWIRPFGRALLLTAAILAVVLAWWLSIEPSNDRDWLGDVAQLPTARFEGDVVTVSNVRDFVYRTETDWDARWEERSYDLDGLVGLDLFLIYWGSPWIAHTILSWGFEDGQHLAVSIETRKEKGEAYSAILGFFRQFELYYVVSDERDVVKLRTNYRGEEVYLYPLRIPLETSRALLVDYLEEINQLAAEPVWYNAAALNCTTAIRKHFQNIAAENPWDWRILVNGKLDEMGYERGTLDGSLPFEEFKRRSDITQAAKAAGDAADFSARIRQGLPGAAGEKR